MHGSLSINFEEKLIMSMIERLSDN